ncbi:hypothetical protein D3C71_1706490 [compost metagenome]
MVRFPVDLLDPPLQLAAQPVTGEHRGAVAMGHTPEHFIEQVPALFTPVAGRLLQLSQQRGRDPRPERPGALRQGRGQGQQVVDRALCPGHLGRVDAMPEQGAGLVTPGAEMVVAVERDHPHSPICTGAWGSRRRSRSRPLRSSACAGR